MNRITETLKMPKNIAAFFVLTFVLSVPPYILAALVPQDMVMLTGLIIALAPMATALILTYRESRLDGVRTQFKRSFDHKRITSKIWYAPIFFLMPFLFFLALGTTVLAGESLPATLFPVAAAPVVFLLFFVFALFEEIGWMGVVFDPMEERWNALAASILLGILWATWHIPLYIFAGQGLIRIVAQLTSLIAIRTLIVWIYNNTGKSVFAAIVIHAVYNVCTLTFSSFYISLGHLVTCLLIVIAAAAVALLWDSESLAQYRFGQKGET